MTKKTGALQLRRPGVSGVVYFSTGSITGASSDLSRQALGRRLVASGHVMDEALTNAVSQVAADPSTGLAVVFQRGEAVDESVLHDAVSEQIVDAVFDLLRWPDGDFTFVMDETNPDDVGVSRSVDDVVVEARRRLEEWSSVGRTVPGPDTVLSFALSVGDDVTASREEWSVLA